MYFNRCQLFLMPVGPLEGQYCASTTYITWKEQVHVSSEVRSMLQCPAKDNSLRPVFINALAVPDNLCHIDSQSEDEWDPAYIIHLHPAVCLRNLLPYSINYLLEVHGITSSSAITVYATMEYHTALDIRCRH